MLIFAFICFVCLSFLAGFDLGRAIGHDTAWEEFCSCPLDARDDGDFDLDEEEEAAK